MTSADLYAIGQESQTAWYLMQDLCKQLGMPFPPEAPAADTTKRDAMPDPLKENMQ